MLEQTLVNMSSTQARDGSATRRALFQPIRFSGRWRTCTSGFPTFGQCCTRSKRLDVALDDEDVLLLEGNLQLFFEMLQESPGRASASRHDSVYDDLVPVGYATGSPQALARLGKISDAVKTLQQARLKYLQLHRVKGG